MSQVPFCVSAGIRGMFRVGEHREEASARAERADRCVSVLRILELEWLTRPREVEVTTW